MRLDSPTHHHHPIHSNVITEILVSIDTIFVPLVLFDVICVWTNFDIWYHSHHLSQLVFKSNQIKILPSNSLSGSLLAWQPEPKSMRARLPVFKLTKMFSSFMSLYTKVSTKVNKKYVERSKMTKNENNGKVDKIKFKDFFMEIRGIFFLCTTFLSRRHVTACSTWNHWALTAATMRKALFLPEWRIYVK